MADKGKSVPRYNINNKSWCGQCTARFTYYGCCLRKNGIPGSHFEPFKNWAHVSECHNECPPWLRKVDKSEKPEVDFVTFPCPWCEKPKDEYPMKGDEAYYRVGDTPPGRVDDDAAGELMGGQMHQGGHQGGHAGTMHGGMTGESMGGQMHPGGHQGGNTGTMHGGVTGERMGGFKRSYFSQREDSALKSQYREGIPWGDMNKHVDIDSNRNGGTLCKRFEKYLVPKMNPSEVESLKEERERNIRIRPKMNPSEVKSLKEETQRNINIGMDQASSSSKIKPAEPAKKDVQRAERVPFNQREDSAIKSQYRQGIPYEDMNKDVDIYSNRRRDSLRNRFERFLVPKMNPSEVESLRKERERNIERNIELGLNKNQIPHPQQHSLGQPDPSMHSGRSHEDQGENQASTLSSSSGHQHGQAQQQPPPGLTEEQRQAYDIIIQNLSAFPKCSPCFIYRNPCDKAEPICTTCKNLNRRGCRPLTAENIHTKRQVEDAMRICRGLGWIVRDLTEDESRFMNRAMAQPSLLGCDYCIRNNLTGCDILSSQPPCQTCASRGKKNKTEVFCRFVSGNTLLEKRRFIEGILDEHEGVTRHASQASQHPKILPHQQQSSLGQPGPSMHSGRSHEGSVSQGMVPIHQEQYINPYTEVSFTGVGIRA
jgi:hypothetical protein